jgi:hypothetical protein
MLEFDIHWAGLTSRNLARWCGDFRDEKQALVMDEERASVPRCDVTIETRARCRLGHQNYQHYSFDYP